MKYVNDTIQLWRVTEDVYGDYNRYAIGYSERFGTVQGTMLERDCKLPIGSYHNEKVKVQLAVFYVGKVLINKVKGA